jgi:hypothetical protein
MVARTGHHRLSLPKNPCPQHPIVHLRNIRNRNPLRTFHLTSARKGAMPKAFLLHLIRHAHYPLMRLGLPLRQGVQVIDFSGGEECCRGVLAGSHAGPTTDAGRRVHGPVGDVLPDQDGVGLGGGTGLGADVGALLDDAVEGRAVDHQVFDDGKTPWPARARR